MSDRKVLFAATALWVLFATTGSAASLLNLRLTPDGSTSPPGDRLDVAVALGPAEKGLTLEVRAFAYLQSERSALVPVTSKNPQARGTKGEFLIQVALGREGGESLVRRAIPIPFADLVLPPGRHKIAYEVRGLAGTTVQFVGATEMTVVVVSDKVRTEMTQTETTKKKVLVRRTADAVIDRNGKLETKPVQITSERFVPEIKERQVQVSIPGEFSRPLSYATRGDEEPDAEVSPKAATLYAFQDRPWAPLSEFEPKSQRIIYFATNRNVAAPDDATPARFGAEVGESVVYGQCVVDIPVQSHATGQLETPSWWQRRDPEKHFLIEALTTLTAKEFQDRTSPRDVLLFIHGYNTDFEYAVLRCSQLVHDLKFGGKGVAYSWPSTAGTTGYRQDEINNAASVGSLVSVLDGLASSGSPLRKIHVIVHSMGNRLFLKAAREYELAHKSSPARKIFGNVVLAAPDVDAASFSALLPSVLRQSETTTLYYCETDRALLASQTLHQNKPVGLGQFFADGLDTVNAENANTSFLGHGYFASEHPLLQDLTLVLFGKKPESRLPPLRPSEKVFGYSLWSFQSPQ